jgi:hypothetical protein
MLEMGPCTLQIEEHGDISYLSRPASKLGTIATFGAILPKSRPLGFSENFALGGGGDRHWVLGKRPRVPLLVGLCRAHTHGNSSRASLFLTTSPILLIDPPLRTTINGEAVSADLIRHRQTRSVAGGADRRSLACANFRQNFPHPIASPHRQYYAPQDAYN